MTITELDIEITKYNIIGMAPLIQAFANGLNEGRFVPSGDGLDFVVRYADWYEATMALMKSCEDVEVE